MRRSRFSCLRSCVPWQPGQGICPLCAAPYLSGGLGSDLCRTENDCVPQARFLSYMKGPPTQTVQERGIAGQALLNPDGTIELVKRTAGTFASVMLATSNLHASGFRASCSHAGLRSSTGVPLIASRPRTLNTLPAMATNSTTVTPMGLGRRGLHRAKTPRRDRSLSPRGCWHKS